MVRTRTGKETVPQQSDSEGEEMNSIRSSKQQGQEAESNIDSATYKLFQKVMAKMMSEQAEENPGKIPSKNKAKGKVSKKQVQYRQHLRVSRGGLRGRAADIFSQSLVSTQESQ